VCHNVLAQVLLYDPRLYQVLLEFDRDLADEAHRGACPRCGGRLDVSDFPRKPRSGPKDLGRKALALGARAARSMPIGAADVVDSCSLHAPG
jgi:hypothetical protein